MPLRLLCLVVFLLIRSAISADLVNVARAELGNTNGSKYVGVIPEVSDYRGWCGDFVAWCLLRAGYQTPIRNSLTQWLKYGETVANPQPGYLVLMPNHIAIVEATRASSVDAIGGDQGNTVSEMNFWRPSVLRIIRPIKKP